LRLDQSCSTHFVLFVCSSVLKIAEHWLEYCLFANEDKVKWRQLVHGVAKPRNEDGWRHSFCIIYLLDKWKDLINEVTSKFTDKPELW